ncbi:MAG: NAD-dependent epimerase/dehydratase family protein [Candidatus Caldarchaeum sp.]|nr:NAD-dependent epimerase/dehydratase family protein [Candidatus Caldarchaeum sp.]
MVDVVVTGGAGFIGGFVVRRLLDWRWRVTVVDDFSTGDMFNLPPPSPLLNVVEHDISIGDRLEALFDGADAVVHLAAVSSVPACEADVEKAFAVNVTGTENVLNACVAKNVEKVVFVSSAAVYGEAEGVITEETPVNPVSVYGRTKLLAETLVQSFSEKKKIEAVVLRVFNAYGKTKAKNGFGVVDQFIDDVVHGRALNVHGDGGQVRDFVYVGDVADAVVSCLERNFDGMEVFNIGSGAGFSVLEVAELVLKAFGKTSSSIVHAPPRPNDVRYSVASVEKARRMLGYSPSVNLKKYVEERAKQLV